jgi:hypothetical protein
VSLGVKEASGMSFSHLVIAICDSVRSVQNGSLPAFLPNIHPFSNSFEEIRIVDFGFVK